MAQEVTPGPQPCGGVHSANSLPFLYNNQYTFKSNPKSSQQLCAYLKTTVDRDFPGSTVVKNTPANVGDTGSSPGPGRSHMPWSN